MVKTFQEGVAELYRSISDRIGGAVRSSADTTRTPAADDEAKRLPENDDLFYLALAKTGHW